jgi:N-acetylmuramoyl-L-alanine amidase
MTMADVRGRRASLTTRAVIAAVLVLAAGSVPGQPGAAALAEGAQARGQRAVAPASEERGAVIRAIAATPLPQGDRITIELSKEVRFEGQRVTNPDRVFFDFTNANAASVLIDRARAIKSPLIKTVRVGVPTPGVTRVVFELAGEPRFSSFPLYNPFRLVIDLENAAPAAPVMPVSTVPAPAPGPAMPPVAEVPAPVATTDKPASERPAVEKPRLEKIVEKPAPETRAAEKPGASDPAPAASNAAKSTPAPAPPSSTRDGDYSLARQLGLRVARIVIDPGHGGHDPGAIANGVTEAELVLDVALKLEKLLQQVPGVEVVLTRRTNEFIPLEERTAIANREHADLFLSIHANSHRKTAVRGIETYFLNFATNPEAEAVAARENATSSQTMGTLPAIVRAIALNNKIAESRELASIVQTIMVRKLRVQSAGVRDLGVKQAPFVVLIGAQMPSVLTEIAFLTNRTEATLLKQPAYRQQIAQALRDGIVRYRESLKKVITVASSK